MTDAAVPAPPAPAHLERVDPAECNDLEAAKHWARYDWAAQFLPAKRVLDCACGMGFGSALLRERGAKEVVGVDISAEAIRAAQRRYARDGVRYVQADALALDRAELGQFDLIVCLETAEHVAQPELLCDIFRRLLKPAGTLALSVPNDEYLQPGNPYHLWRAEFATVRHWLAQRFRHVACYAELQVIGSAIWPLDQASDRAARAVQVPVAQRATDALPIQAATGFVFACGQSPPKAVGVTEATLLDGLGYVRELERVRDKLLAESQRLAQAWETQKGHIDNQAARIQELEHELEQVWAEARRLSRCWETQKGHIDAQAERIQQLVAECDRLAREREGRGQS